MTDSIIDRRPSSCHPDRDGGGGAAGSFAAAGDLLAATAGILIRAVTVAVPIALITVRAWIVSRGVRRRRRESVLA